MATSVLVVAALWMKVCVSGYGLPETDRTLLSENMGRSNAPTKTLLLISLLLKPVWYQLKSHGGGAESTLPIGDCIGETIPPAGRPVGLIGETAIPISG